MFEPLQKFFKKAANTHGIAIEIFAAEVCHNFRTLIPEIFDNKKSPENHIQPAFFKKNTLVINVENPGWAQEVIIRKEKIIEEMNKKAGKEIIKNLRTQLKKP